MGRWVFWEEKVDHCLHTAPVGGYKRLNGPLNKTVEHKLRGVFRCTKTNGITVGQLLRTVLFIAKFVARTTRFPKTFLYLHFFCTCGPQFVVPPLLLLLLAVFFLLR